MDLNKIKLLKKEELLEKLKQRRFTEVVNILQDKEINGEKLIDLKEFEIFKWKLSQSQKKCLWACIKEIKAKPSILLEKEKPTLLERNASFSQDVSSTNLFKGKLEGLLGAAGATGGSAPALANKRTTNISNVNKDVHTLPKRKPPPPIRSLIDQPGTSNKQPQKIIRKPAMPLPPEEIINENRDARETRDLAEPDSSDVVYMDMQTPMEPKRVAEVDDDYLTPKELSEPNLKKSIIQFPQKNNSFARKETGKNSKIPCPPPLPNKNINLSKKNNLKEIKPLPHTLPSMKKPVKGQINLPRRNSAKIEKQEDEDTYEPAPNVRNAINLPRTPNYPKNNLDRTHNTNSSNLKVTQILPAGANSRIIKTNKFSIEVITDDTEESNYESVSNEEKRLHKNFSNSKGYVQFPNNDDSDDTYEQPPALKEKVIPNKNKKIASSKPNNSFYAVESAVEEAQASNTKKPTIKELENLLIINDNDSTQAQVKATITAKFNSLFRNKNKLKNAYENHSIQTEKRESKSLSIRNRSLPRVPVENIEHDKETEAMRRMLSRPLPPPRLNIPPADSQYGYVELIKPLDVPNKSSPPSTSPQQDDSDEGHTYLNLAGTAGKGNMPYSSNRGKQKSTPTRDGNIKLKDKVSGNTEDEQLTEYENKINHNAPTQQILSQEQLASLLAEQLRQRNLTKVEAESAHSDSEFGDDDDDDADRDQPIYDNTPTSSNTMSHKKNILHQSLFKNHTPSPTRNISKVHNESYDDESDQPVYDNTLPLSKTQGKNNSTPNSTLFKNKSPTPNLTRAAKETLDDDDDDSSSYGNLESAASLISNLKNQFKIDPSRSPLFKKSPAQTLSDGEDNDDDDESRVYGNVAQSINPLIPNINIPNQRRINFHPNPLPFNKNVLSLSSANVDKEISEDANSPSYDKVDETPIYKRPLPDVPKGSLLSKNNTFQSIPTLSKNLQIRDNSIPTPPSTDEEDINDENITYGNVEASKPTFKRLPPVPVNQILNNKPSKVDKTGLLANKGTRNNSIDAYKKPLPKPPIAEIKDYERHMVNSKSEQNTPQVVTSEDQVTTIFNINNEQYYRNTDRKGAKQLLRDLEDGAFLFRNSKEHFLVLTVKDKGKFYNLGIERSSKNGIRLKADGNSLAPEFTTLGGFVEYFKNEPVTFQDKDTIVEIYLKPILPDNLF